jgi:gustatory receptor
MFGLFPFSGLCSKDPKEIKFTWFSLRTLFSASFFVAVSTSGILVLYQLAQAGPLTVLSIRNIQYFINIAIMYILLFKFSMKFGLVLRRWRQVEKNLKKSKFFNVSIENGWSLRRRTAVCSAVGLLLAFLDHTLSMAPLLLESVNEFEAFNSTKNSWIDYKAKKIFTFVFDVIEYNRFYAIIVEYYNVSYNLCWNFFDIFLMMISIGLSYNYERINNRIEFFKERTISDKIWEEVRKDYNQVSELVKFVNENVGSMIVMACFNGSYTILVQLLNFST